MNAILGLKTIPRRFVPLFDDEKLYSNISEAAGLIHQAPSPWELVELPEEEGNQLHAVPIRAIPKNLSASEEKEGRELINNAYAKINATLKIMDRRLALL